MVGLIFSMLCCLSLLLKSSSFMASLNKLWSWFSLTEEEEGGPEVTHKVEAVIHWLVGKFFTKRVLNVDAVARTFKPLWKPNRKLKI